MFADVVIAAAAAVAATTMTVAATADATYHTILFIFIAFSLLLCGKKWKDSRLIFMEMLEGFNCFGFF